jgi:single-strand DNA-binding protein
MANENVITIVGNLADDPELRYTPNGVAVANVRVAVNQRFFNKETNAWDERLDGFFTCNVWRDHAENIAESLHRGTRVMVTGRLRSRSYEDKDGQTRWVTEIEADEICPSLRWATAKVTRSNRGGGGGGGNGGGNADTSWGGAPAPAAPPAADDVPF